VTSAWNPNMKPAAQARSARQSRREVRSTTPAPTVGTAVGAAPRDSAAPKPAIVARWTETDRPGMG
jgi:hypothetical protein